MLDFAGLPPEINSAQMYSGPGSAPMLSAATAWNAMAAEMRSAAASYGSVVAALTSQSWLGPSSTSMVAVRSLVDPMEIVTVTESWVGATCTRRIPGTLIVRVR